MNVELLPLLQVQRDLLREERGPARFAGVVSDGVAPVGVGERGGFEFAMSDSFLGTGDPVAALGR